MAAKVQAGKADPYVRKKALDLTRYLKQKDWRSEIKSLFEFVRDRIRYIRDINGIETVYDAAQVLSQGQGDCDDKCILLASLLESIQHPTRFVALGFEPGDFSHVIVQTKLGPNWISLDPTEPRPVGWMPPGVVSVMIQSN